MLETKAKSMMEPYKVDLVSIIENIPETQKTKYLIKNIKALLTTI
jgi:hypothetical protein